MKYLAKTPESKVLQENLKYKSSGSNEKLREDLLNEQDGFCAYSERFVENTDATHVEHFDPRKNENRESYWNYYTTLVWLNEHKPKKIEPFLPILKPYSKDLKERIYFENGIFKAKNQDDIEAKNLIEYLGFNKYEMKTDRDNHVERVKDLRKFHNSDQAFKEFLFLDKNKIYLSFRTALEAEFEFLKY